MRPGYSPRRGSGSPRVDGEPPSRAVVAHTFRVMTAAPGSAMLARHPSNHRPTEESVATLVAIGYPDQTTAQQARETVQGLEADLIIQADQVASISRDLEGKYHVHTN